MIISDLNYLEVVQVEVTGGYNFGGSSRTNIDFNFDIDSSVYSNLHLRGNFAGAQADALATGSNTYTNAVSTTNVLQGYGSASTATSVSATNGFHW